MVDRKRRGLVGLHPLHECGLGQLALVDHPGHDLRDRVVPVVSAEKGIRGELWQRSMPRAPTLLSLLNEDRKTCFSPYNTVYSQWYAPGNRANEQSVEKGAVDWGEGAVAEKFVRYVEENLRA